MSELKRYEVKYIRDGAKTLYKKGDECYICGNTTELEFHHFYSVTALWEVFKRKNKVVIRNVDDIMHWREVFIEQNKEHIYENTVTLCHYHHNNVLHKIYGQAPPLATAEKQRNWCEKQRAKYYASE
jgi:hypothetical protein